MLAPFLFTCLQAGESLTSVAGLFETSWLQLFALNPTFHNADAPVRNDTAIAVGHPYAFGQGETLHSVIRCETFSAKITDACMRWALLCDSRLDDDTNRHDFTFL